jgi:RNA polymerase sigma factor (sigma-70 family)
VVLLADLETAISMAKLTERQSEALRLVYEEDLTQEEAGKLMGIAQNSVSEAVDRAVENIAEVYWFWSRHGEGYSVGGADNVKPN